MVKRIERTALVPHSAVQMFALINDVAAYPQYMPGCRRAEVLESSEHWQVARLELASAGLSQSFTTRNTLVSPTSITMTLVEGPFSQFHGQWQFHPLADKACRVRLCMSFALRRGLANFALARVLEQVAAKQVDAVCQRAKQLYA